MRDGKKLGRPLVMPLDASRTSDDLFMYGNSVKLSGLPGPGDYELRFEIRDEVAGVSATRELLFVVTD